MKNAVVYVDTKEGACKEAGDIVLSEVGVCINVFSLKYNVS